MWKQHRETDCKSDGSRGDLEGQNIIRTLKMKGKGGRERGQDRRGERREGFAVSQRRKMKTLHVFLLSFQRFCGSRVKSCHLHFKKRGPKAQRLREAVNEWDGRKEFSSAPYLESSIKDIGEEQSWLSSPEHTRESPLPKDGRKRPCQKNMR